MMVHPGNHQQGTRAAAEPLRRRPRERLAGGLFQLVTRVAGLRPAMIPDHLRRQLRLIGVDAELEHRVLPRLRSLADWPYDWEAAGDAYEAAGDRERAFACFYVAQRILLQDSPLKRRLYGRARAAYRLLDQPAVEEFAVPAPSGATVRGILQLPEGVPAGRPVPCVVVVPGVTGTKEEVHAWARRILRRGIAVARMDNPRYGDTDGKLDAAAFQHPARVVDHLRQDPRIDGESIHLFGMSLGALFAQHSAAVTDVASLSVICPPFRPHRYLKDLPTLNLVALRHMTGMQDLDEMTRLTERMSMADRARHVTCPTRIFVAGRDRTVPPEDGIELAAALPGEVALTVFERDHHNCLEHVDEITDDIIEVLEDPAAAVKRHRRRDRLRDEPAAEPAVEEGLVPTPAPRHVLARLPFYLPWARPAAEDRSATAG